MVWPRTVTELTGAVEVLVLAPVHPLLRARGREVSDITDEGKAFRAWGIGQARRGRGEEALEDVQGEAARGEVCKKIKASHVQKMLYVSCRPARVYLFEGVQISELSGIEFET